MSRPAAKPIPDGFHSLSAYLVAKNAAAAIEFYKKAFGAEREIPTQRSRRLGRALLPADR